MGKREKKTAKGRIDKYYKLAKEQGYRARSAFKLIQLDRKYNFLGSAKCCIDLCAAPGGWLQVAAKFMPPNSVIVGVDLAPIKPIPRVVSFVEDITTPACRTKLRAEVKDWKADVVLHDGAPNVGTAWVQDAFTQAELVLASLKLAVEFLAPGGIFVTKIFRSKDYNSLLWVFNQLFQKAEATKPPSSRNVSAEIFVVCTGFLAPKKLDPKLLDPTYVFKDLQPATVKTASNSTKLTAQATNIFHPEKKRRKREGYADGDYTLFHLTPVENLITSSQDPIQVLSDTSRFSFESAEGQKIQESELTNDEIMALCQDLKVLGKRDFKTLLKWRLALRKAFGLDIPEVDASAEAVEISPLEQAENADLAMEDELVSLSNKATARARRERRKTNEKRNKDVLKLQLNMTTPMDVGQDSAAGGMLDMFDLRLVDKKGKAKQIANQETPLQLPEDLNEMQMGSEDGSEYDSDESDAGRKARLMGSNLDELYEEYQTRKLDQDAKHRAKRVRHKRALTEGGEWTGIESDGSAASEPESEDSMDELVDASSSDSSDDDAGPTLGQKRARNGKLITDLQDKPAQTKAAIERERQAAIWYDQAVFKNIDGLDKLLQVDSLSQEPIRSRSAKDLFQPDEVVEWSSDEEEQVDDLAFTLVPAQDEQSKEDAQADRVARLGLNTAEAITLATQLVNREKTKAQLLDEGFNRHAFNDKDDVPSWFIDDEMRHFRNNIPVTKEAVQLLKANMRALDARPIKKVAEAKARKKMRAGRRLGRMQKSADYINDNPDISEKEKSSSIAKLMAKATKDPKSKKKEVKLVVARGANRGVSGRPKGVKGRYKMVDSRMKKELRAAKRVARQAKGKKR